MSAASGFEVLPHIGQVRPSGIGGKFSYSELLEIRFIAINDNYDNANGCAALFIQSGYREKENS